MWTEPPGDPVVAATAHRLDDFAQCADLALALAHDFDHAHVAALVELNGIVVDGVVLSDPSHTIDHAVGYALALERIYRLPVIGDVIFISVVADDADRLREAHVASWRRICDVFTDWPEARDWIITDGTTLRSMAISTGSDDAWPDMPETPPNTHGAGA